MKISSVTLEHTNPSLGPYEKIITIRLSNAPAHEARMEQFLKEAMVNQTVSLEQYLKAVVTEDKALLQQVQDNAPNGPLMEGASISNFTILLEEQSSVAFYDVYRRYNLSHFYGDFTRYMVEHGTRTEGHMGDKILPLWEDDDDTSFSKEPPKPE